MRGVVVRRGSKDVSIPSTFCVYRRNKRPSSARVASIWWNNVGSACRVMCDISRTISWKDAVEESVLYTAASKRCFPEDFKLCWLRNVVKSPVEDLKSGTKTQSIMATRKNGAFLTASRDGNSCACDHYDLPLRTQDFEKAFQLYIIVGDFLHAWGFIESQIQIFCRALFGLIEFALFGGW